MKRSRLGSVYRCPICGAELTVIRQGAGTPAPHCCNEPMELVERTSDAFRCPVCASEVMVVSGEPPTLEPVCCSRSMAAINV